MGSGRWALGFPTCGHLDVESRKSMHDTARIAQPFALCRRRDAYAAAAGAAMQSPSQPRSRGREPPSRAAATAISRRRQPTGSVSIPIPAAQRRQRASRFVDHSQQQTSDKRIERIVKPGREARPGHTSQAGTHNAEPGRDTQCDTEAGRDTQCDTEGSRHRRGTHNATQKGAGDWTHQWAQPSGQNNAQFWPQDSLALIRLIG